MPEFSTLDEILYYRASGTWKLVHEYILGNSELTDHALPALLCEVAIDLTRCLQSTNSTPQKKYLIFYVAWVLSREPKEPIVFTAGPAAGVRASFKRKNFSSKNLRDR